MEKNPEINKRACPFIRDLRVPTQPFNTVTWYDLLLRGDQINEFAAMSETELRLNLQ